MRAGALVLILAATIIGALIARFAWRLWAAERATVASRD
jgi:hypothetical protein